jgi:PAS domain S-box-containing protein
MNQETVRLQQTARPAAGPQGPQHLMSWIADQGPAFLFRFRLAPDRGFESVSPSVTPLTGYMPAEFYADPNFMFSFVLPEDRPLLEAVLSGKWPAGRPLTLRWLRKDGSQLWTEMRTVLAPNETGEPVAIEGLCWDITAQKEAEGQQARVVRQSQATEAQFRGVLDAAPDSIVIANTNGQIVLVNRQTESLFGYMREELMGMPVENLLPEHFRSIHVAHRAIYTAAPQARPMGVGLDLIARRKDGSEFPVEISLSPLSAAGQDLVIATVRDLTDRKRLESQLRQLLIREQALHAVAEAERSRVQVILESAPHGIMYLDAVSGDVSINPRAREIFGFSMGEQVTLPQIGALLRFPDGRELALNEMVVSRALQGDPLTNEERLIVREDQRTVPVLASGSAVRDAAGTIVGAIVAFEDMTSLKELERLREEWSLIIAHDLRQPLASMQMQLAAMELFSGQDGAPDKTKESLEHLRAAAANMSNMISDLLDFSRIEASRLEIERFPLDIPSLVQRVSQRAGDQAAGHAIRVQVLGSIPTVSADAGRIEQVLTNLISNAAKYGATDTDILIGVTSGPAGVEVTVTNEGPGIEHEELPNLFGRFYRTSQSRSGRVAGLGLGLYICRGLVEAHGGRIWAESVPGHTTTFRFTLPLAATAGVSA